MGCQDTTFMKRAGVNRADTYSKVPAVLGIVFLCAACVLCGLLWFWGQSTQTLPSPRANANEQTVDEDGFPDVDWEYWLSVNSDIIGWISVEGTTINSPIVQAHENNPDYYLKHDLYGNYSPYGSIYLDVECEEYGLSSKNAVIMGHHFGYNNPSDYHYEVAPFTVLTKYHDASFAEEHKTILIQTPNSKMTYEVRFTQIVNGAKATKRTSFENEKDYREWYTEALEDAVMVLDDDTEPNQTISLVSCSYYIWTSNERTVVTTSQALS